MSAHHFKSTPSTSLDRRRLLGLMGGLAAGSLLAPARLALADHGELGGQPFTSPDSIMQMPENWVSRGIKRPEGVDLMLALDQQIYPALLPFAMRFGTQNGLKLGAQEGTCGLASAALSEKCADITGMCCPPGAIDRLPGIRFHTIGISAVALIVHPSNPLQDISWAQARALFAGGTRSWSDIPMSGIARKGEVRAITRLHCKPRPGHWRLLIGEPDHFARQALDVPSIKDMIIEVSETLEGIGWETLFHVEANAKIGQVKTLKLGGISPSDEEALARGRYPFYRVMGITSWADAPAAHPMATRLAAELIAQADAIDPRFGIVSVTRLRKHGWKFHNAELVGEPG
ncbi:MAG: hypothetical protein HQL43_10375 [Alphaproteobacteria bacterium]|nr:hypothetical protein [Alphaproteobacteria bacterium]